ncbi:hypothetical protein BD809_101345 [Aquimarina intermedia]|uniref:Uncharacterized protein n=1 Tax=Aquimarina intermedia TaxID=350814 RepID=A0A5S5CCV1_9FLAO|nr:hypothetical protein BD809_101345 [Aquimarina intermedia]
MLSKISELKFNVNKEAMNRKSKLGSFVSYFTIYTLVSFVIITLILLVYNWYLL